MRIDLYPRFREYTLANPNRSVPTQEFVWIIININEVITSLIYYLLHVFSIHTYSRQHFIIILHTVKPLESGHAGNRKNV